MKKIAIAILSVIMMTSCILLVGCGGENSNISRSDRVFRPAPYSYELLGETVRTTPIVKDGGLLRYPTLDSRMPNATIEEKQAVLNENTAMFDYDKIDQHGDLYKTGVKKDIKLYKHSAADGQIGGAVNKSGKAVIKKIHIIPSTYGNNPTGLYAPAGELIKIELSEADAKRGMYVSIGMGSARGGSVDIPVKREYSRMPILRKTVKLTETVSYVGSPLGGPIYMQNEGDSNETNLKGMPYDVVISGAVETPHYYLGYTTDAEWERLKDTAGTIFDMDIYGGIRMTMPSSIVKTKSAENMRNVAEFWEKASAISNKYSNGGWYADHPVTQIYDTYIPAGAAVAFVGADFSCLPISWANGVMNYDNFILNGAWGDIHEFNHHHQGWGAEGGGEVTNNVINITTYMLHTNIGAQRTETGGLGGWNVHTSAYLTLRDALGRVGNGVNTSISMYTTLLHAFGEEAMIATAKKTGARTNENWYKEASKAMGYDLTYYLETLCGFNLGQSAKDEIAALHLPIFVPIANTYQAGRDIVVKTDSGYANSDVIMGKPFYIQFGKDKKLDLDAYMVVPSDIAYEIKSVSTPTVGKLKNDGHIGKYVYTPDKNSKEAGEIRVKVGLSFKNNPDKKIEDVTLILRFMQDYAGADGKIWNNPGYSDLTTALDEGFEKLESTDTQFSYAGADTLVPNTILMSQGKIVLSDGKYKFYIRGNEEVLLYTGTDINNLSVSAHITEKLNAYDRTRINSFFEVQLKKDTPLYFKLYVRSSTKGGTAFGRIGYEDFSQAQGAPPVINGSQGTGEIALTPIIDLPPSTILHNDARLDAPSRVQYTSNLKYASEYKANGIIMLSTKDFRVSSAPPMYGNHVPDDMLDGNFNTIAHSATNIKFPVEFVIDMKSKQSFNLINLYSREKGSNRGRVKEFEILVADTLVEGFTSVYKGTVEDIYKTTLVFKKNINAKYIKIVVNSVYGESYICFSEIQLGTVIANADVAPASGKDIIYKGKWSEQSFGQFLNGRGLVGSNEAIAEVNFHGTDFMLFASTGLNFGAGKIRIDDGDWADISFYSETTKYAQPIYGITNLDDGYHKVEIKAEKGSKINIDYFGISPTTPPQVIGLGLWWIAIAIVVVVGCVAIGAGGYYAARWWKDKPKTNGKRNIFISVIDSFKTKNAKELPTEKPVEKPVKTEAKAVAAKPVVVDEKPQVKVVKKAENAKELPTEKPVEKPVKTEAKAVAAKPVVVDEKPQVKVVKKVDSTVITPKAVLKGNVVVADDKLNKVTSKPKPTQTTVKANDKPKENTPAKTVDNGQSKPINTSSKNKK